MKLSNNQYDMSKWIIAIVMPALGVLIGALGKVYGWSWTDSAVTTISAVAAFLGTVFMISSSQYKKESDQ